MKLIYALLILIVFFAGVGFLIHICSKNKYVFKYSSSKKLLSLILYILTYKKLKVNRKVKGIVDNYQYKFNTSK